MQAEFYTDAVAGPDPSRIATLQPSPVHATMKSHRCSIAKEKLRLRASIINDALNPGKSAF
jgi:hypothetical protein